MARTNLKEAEFVNGSVGQEDERPLESVREALAAIRKHLGMEVAYVSQFVGNRTIFYEVNAPGMEQVIKSGDSASLDDVYCRHILAGRLPEFMPDTSQNPLAQSLPITHAVPIGAHLSVPIRDRDGTVFGMFCSLSRQPNPKLHERDLGVMRVFADMMAHQLAGRVEATRLAAERAERIGRTIEEGALLSVYQTIWDFQTLKPVGVEALTRFTREPYRSPDQWFAEAFEVGLGVELELKAIAGALRAFELLPEPLYVSINTSPETILSGKLAEALRGCPARRVVIEVTEHAVVEDYVELAAALEPIRAAGATLAIDDVGAGFSSLQHILQLKPERIKLDMSLTRSIHTDPARRALAAALVFFAHETNSSLIAEGIEQQEEFDVLRMLGVHKGQGYFFARPADIETVVARGAEALERVRA